MPTPLCVMTYNIRDGGHPRTDLILDVIASANPDLVLLNEADDLAVVADLAYKLERTQIWGRGSGDKHIALLSRWPIQQWRVYNRRPITQSLLEAHIAVRPDTVLKIYGVHLLPYFMLLPYELARWRTVSSIVRLARTDQQDPHLVLGDFNAVTPGESADFVSFPPRIKRFVRWQGNRFPRLALGPLARAGYMDAFRTLHPQELGLTWMSQQPTARLDYIFADQKMAACLRACHVVTCSPAELASDHFPLVAEFDLDRFPV